MSKPPIVAKEIHDFTIQVTLLAEGTQVSPPSPQIVDTLKIVNVVLQQQTVITKGIICSCKEDLTVAKDILGHTAIVIKTNTFINYLIPDKIFKWKL